MIKAGPEEARACVAPLGSLRMVGGTGAGRAGRAAEGVFAGTDPDAGTGAVEVACVGAVAGTGIDLNAGGRADLSGWELPWPFEAV